MKPKQLALNNGDASRARVKSTRWHGRFLKALRRNPNIAMAARAAGVNRATVYRHKNEIESFALRFQEVLDSAVDKVEATAFKLAGNGNEKMIELILRSHRRSIYDQNARLDIGLLGGVVIVPAKNSDASESGTYKG